MSRQKGYHHTKITKEKIGKSNKGKRLSKKTEFKKGHRHSEETKRLMREAKLRNPPSFWKGKRIDEKTKKKISKTLKGRIKRGEVLDNSKFLIEHIQKFGPWNKGKKMSKKTREKQRLKAIERITRGDHPKLNTDIEIILREELGNQKMDFIPQWNLDNLFSCDFYLPKFNCIIECDGIYWHNMPSNRIRDGFKRFTCSGKHRLLRFSDKQIKNNLKDLMELVNVEELKYFDWRGNWELKILNTKGEKINDSDIRRMDELNKLCEEKWGTKNDG